MCAVPTACRTSENGSFAATPAEEYARVSSLAGEGKVFDIDAMTSFEVQHNASYRSDRIVSDDGDGIANVSAIYQYSHLGDTYKSYAVSRHIWDFATESDSEIFTPVYENGVSAGFQNNTYYYADGKKLENTSYSEILDWTAQGHGDTPESIYRKYLTLPAVDLLENFEGGKSGGTYTIMATVKDDGWDGFTDWMRTFYFYFRFTEEQGGFFSLFDFNQPHSARLTVRSTRTMVTDVVLQLETYGKYDMGPMRFEAKTTFKSGGVSVLDIGR